MRNAGVLQQARYRGAIVLGAAVTAAVAAFALAPAGAAQSGRPVPLGQAARPRMLFPGSNELEGVFCTSRTNCVAVGLHATKIGALVNVIVHWNGTKWSNVPVPSPAGTETGDFSILSAVRCVSAANCWAVGQDANRGQALHWNGKKWSVVTTPEPGGTGRSGFTQLRDLACPSANNCWAAGQYGHETISSQTHLDLILHWNGTKWSKVAAPNPAGTKANDFNELDAVRCASPSDCWAAGLKGVAGPSDATSVLLNNVLHWNGTKWSTRTVPSPGGSAMGSLSELFSLACTSTSNCLAVGEYHPASLPASSLNQSLHWNGRKWSSLTTPEPDGTVLGADNNLIGVTCAAKDNCWAVGDYGNISSGGSQIGLALHWNGTKWKLIATPDPAGTANQARNALNSVRCVSAKDCWIVGLSQVNGQPDKNLFLHWNGVKWSAG